MNSNNHFCKNLKLYNDATKKKKKRRRKKREKKKKGTKAVGPRCAANGLLCCCCVSSSWVDPDATAHFPQQQHTTTLRVIITAGK
jgi:hypothetical protein